MMGLRDRVERIERGAGLGLRRCRESRKIEVVRQRESEDGGAAAEAGIQ